MQIVVETICVTGQEEVTRVTGQVFSRIVTMWWCVTLTLLAHLAASDGLRPDSVNASQSYLYVERGQNLKNIFRISPPFLAREDNTPCGLESQRYLRDLNNLQLWAVRMYDASGRLPSGLLNGNVHAFGDYWQCLEIDEELGGGPEEGGGHMKGKFCQVEAYVEVSFNTAADSQLSNIMDLMLSHRAVQNNFTDGVRFFPTFTPITWGFCVPSSCDHQDVTEHATGLLRPYNHSSGLVFRLKSSPGSCDVNFRSNFLSGPACSTILLLLVILTMALLGTVLDFCQHGRPHIMVRLQRNLVCRVSLCFSLRKNWIRLVDTSGSTEDIGCVHGIRFIFSLTIYLLHRGVFGMFVPFSNRTAVAKSLEGDWTMIFRAFWNNVDSFVVLSGLLTSYYGIKKLQGGQRFNILYLYWQRYFKFAPMYLITLLVIRNVAVQLRAGPNATRVAKHFVESCQGVGFWKNLFFAGNLDGMNNMCYPPAHQLITDMQMYLISPFVLLLLWRYQKGWVRSLACAVTILTIYKGCDIYLNNMGTFIYYGATLSEMLTSANKMYLNPLHRLVPYLFGIGLGFFIRTSGRHAKLTMEQVNFGWGAAIIAAFYSFFGPRHAAKRDYVFDIHESVVYGMLQPILWSGALCWVIFACYSGRGGFINKVLTWKGFIVFSRLSYAFYLTQILVIFWGISGSMTPEYMRMHQIVDLNELMCVMLMSLIFTLLFLMPLGDLQVILLGCRQSSNASEQTLVRTKSFSRKFSFEKLPLNLAQWEKKER